MKLDFCLDLLNYDNRLHHGLIEHQPLSLESDKGFELGSFVSTCMIFNFMDKIPNQIAYGT